MSEEVFPLDSWPDQTDIQQHMPLLEETASKCLVIIELGCGHGNGSTRAFARGLSRCARASWPAILVSVDVDPERPEVEPTLLSRGVGWLKISGRSEDPHTATHVARLLNSWHGHADLIFIDTVHEYDQLAKELALWSYFADHNTTWLFHDTWMFGTYNHMTDAILDYCRVHPGWEYVELTRESHGLGMMRWRG